MDYLHKDVEVERNGRRIGQEYVTKGQMVEDRL